MSNNNRKIREKMIEIFGEKCFIEELHLRTKEDIQEEMKKYTSKYQRRIMDLLTYHHILERCHGGKATLENGALLRYVNHQWLHRLPKKQRDQMNKLFQEYKKQFFKKMEVQMTDDFESGIEINFAELEFSDKGIKKGKNGRYNRAQVKRDTRKMQDEYERGEQDD